MQNVSEFEKSSIRKNWQQDSTNELSRGSLSRYFRDKVLAQAEVIYEE